ncbi:App1 family protein [Marinobacter zhanjiangensis]|uniref:Phosphatase n=1 Tax=Marinobacter zhanjiangensis TaxID=578215 RepID=A0ABQ3B8R4_9GAMM|nr:phosphatase domain-containing protein [Marinobacter zhanjiangensis]GGY82724.1 phosphatase [Marinobacter zhanjiangensis]
MPHRKRFRRYLASVRRGLHILAAPVKGDNGRGGLFIQAYRGFGSRDRVFLMGRVFRQPGFGADMREDSLRRDLLDVVRRLLRKPIVGGLVRVRYKDTTAVVETDQHGYFRVDMNLGQMPSDVTWHVVELSLDQPTDERATTTGEFFTPTHTAGYGVISDIDDTVVYTGVANTLKMMWRLFAQGADSRVIFNGVPDLYKGFHDGPEGNQGNPLIYVSRGPWSIYQVLVEMFRLHRIPNGPILILREWGMKRGSLLPRRARDHKLDAIRHVLDLYHSMSFVLVGDSGQHDPEVYSRVLQEYPGRILAIYIRDVSADSDRAEAIAKLAEKVRDSGCELVLSDDNRVLAEHAAEHGLISEDALAAVQRTEVSASAGHEPA